MPTLTLTLRPEELSVCRLPAGSPWPPPPQDGTLFSVTASEAETSVVCRSGSGPPGAVVEEGWQALTVAGPLEFSMVGVLAALAGPLADAGIGIFVLSTFDTDHLMVKARDLGATATSLRSHGHTVHTGHTGHTDPPA